MSRCMLQKYMIIICVLFFLVFLPCNQIYAKQNDSNITQENNTQVQVDETDETDGSNGFNFLSFVFGASLVSFITGIIGIKTYIADCDYEIEKIYIEMLDEKPVDIGRYSVLKVKKIEQDSQNIEIGEKESRYLSVLLTVSRNSTKKKIDNLIIQYLNIDWNGYKVTYGPDDDSSCSEVLCGVDQGTKTYSILLIPPTAKKMENNDELNVVNIFKNPTKFIMHISFLVIGKQVWMRALMRTKKRKVLFKQSVKQNNSSGVRAICIESHDIKEDE